MGKDEGYDCVLPVTLETNVVKLHEFLYPEDAYAPSATVKSTVTISVISADTERKIFRPVPRMARFRRIHY